MTTNKSPLKPKLGIPAGEAEEVEIPESYKKQQEVERIDDNSPKIHEKDIAGKNEYIVTIQKSTEKKDEEKK